MCPDELVHQKHFGDRRERASSTAGHIVPSSLWAVERPNQKRLPQGVSQSRHVSLHGEALENSIARSYKLTLPALCIILGIRETRKSPSFAIYIQLTHRHRHHAGGDGGRGAR